MIEPRYQLLEKIGESSRSTVFRARDLEDQREVAIKRPTAHLLQGETFREGEALSQLHHPHIISLLDQASDTTGPYLIFEMMAGETLETRIQRAALSVADVLALARQGLEALQAVHDAGFIHRDVKPENLMLLPADAADSGQPFHLKLFDFDLTHPLGATPADTATGSVYFMAPEQFENKRPDVRTDLYAFGAVLHYALTQRYPFEGETKAQVITAHLYHDCISLKDLRPDAPAPLVEWLTSLVSLNPNHRPASAAEALAQLASFA